VKVTRILIEKGISKSKGPDGPWEKVSYQLEAALEFEGEEQAARQKLEGILDTWLGVPGAPAPAPEPAAAPGPLASVMLHDKEVARIYQSLVEISAPLLAEDPAVKGFLIPRVLKETGIPYDLRLKGDLLVGVAFKGPLSQKQVQTLERTLAWVIDKALSRGGA